MTYEETLAHLLSLLGREVFVTVVGREDHTVASLTGTLRRAQDGDLVRPTHELPPDHEAMCFTFEEDGLSEFVIHRSHFEGAELDGPILTIRELGLSVAVVLRPGPSAS